MSGSVSGGRRRLLTLLAAASASRIGLGWEQAWSLTASPALSKPRFGGIEAAALNHLREHRPDDAIAVLEGAFDQGLSSLRLLDLLATLYARKGRLEKLAALADRVEAAAQNRSHVPRIAAAMLGRADKWRNEHSKWRRDRANPQASIKWCEAGGRTGKYARRDDIVIPV